MVFKQRPDREARTQESAALFIGNRLIPDVHAPFVGRHVKQLGVRAVSHRHLVLGAQESGCGKHRLALGAVAARRGRVARTVFGDEVRAAGLQVDVGGPGDLVDIRERIAQLAGGGVNHVEEAVAVSLGAHALAVHVKGDELVGAVKVPGVIGRVLVTPGNLAGLHVDGDGGRREQVVALAHMAVPRAGVAGAEISQAGLGVVGAAHPGGGAAGFPGLAGPGGVGGAADAVFLAVLVAHVAFNRGAGPDQLASFRVARINAADHAELATGQAGQQQAVSDQRSGGGAVASGVIVDFFFPDHFAGVLVQRHQLGVERGEDHQVVKQGRTPVHHVAARHDAFRQAVLVLPELLAGLGVQRVQARVGSRDKHLALVDQRLGFLAALLFTAEGHGPDRCQAADGLGVDRFERRMPLALRAQSRAQHGIWMAGIGADHGVCHLRADLGRGEHDQKAD